MSDAEEPKDIEDYSAEELAALLHTDDVALVNEIREIVLGARHHDKAWFRKCMEEAFHDLGLSPDELVAVLCILNTLSNLRKDEGEDPKSFRKV